MKRDYYKTKREAIKAAHSFLLDGTGVGEFTTTDKTVSVSVEGGKDEELYTIVRVKGKRSFGIVCRLSFQSEWTLTAYKEENLTYPFRGVDERGLFVLCALNATFCKPEITLTTDEAKTPDGARTIYSFFGSDIMENLERVRIDEDGDLFLYDCLPCLIEEETGKTIRDAEEYADAISSMIGRAFNEEQRQEARDSYEFAQADHFLKYSLYEFLRTESYGHLKEILSEYSKFGLSEDWENNHFPLRRLFKGRESKAEAYVIARYLSNEAREKVGKQSYRELAEFTGTPLGLIYKVLRSRGVWD